MGECAQHKFVCDEPRRVFLLNGKLPLKAIVLPQTMRCGILFRIIAKLILNLLACTQNKTMIQWHGNRMGNSFAETEGGKSE